MSNNCFPGAERWEDVPLPADWVRFRFCGEQAFEATSSEQPGQPQSSIVSLLVISLTKTLVCLSSRPMNAGIAAQIASFQYDNWTSSTCLLERYCKHNRIQEVLWLAVRILQSDV